MCKAEYVKHLTLLASELCHGIGSCLFSAHVHLFAGQAQQAALEKEIAEAAQASSDEARRLEANQV